MSAFGKLLVAVAIVGALAFAAAGGAAAQESKSLLKHGITGSVGSRTPDRENPSYVLDRLPIQKLLLSAALAPVDRKTIDAALAGTSISLADLETIGLLRRLPPESGQRDTEHWAIAFTLFTTEDVAKVREAAEARAKSLAQAYLARRAEIDAALKKYSLDTVDLRAVAYFVLGCFSLDWDGLDLTAKRGYRTEAKKRANGDDYAVWAEEIGEYNLKGIYWGSHNSYHAEAMVTSFGDHYSLPRAALPDLVWRLSSSLAKADVPDSAKQLALNAGRDALDGMMETAGKIMLRLRAGPLSEAEIAKAAGLSLENTKNLLALLIELGYVREEGGRYAAMIPVLGAEDAAMVRELRRISWSIMDDWLKQNYSSIRDDLRDITPLRYGVPYNEVFTQVWHYLFGIANRHLVEVGLFADPYDAGRKYKGFIPVIWHESLAKFDN